MNESSRPKNETPGNGSRHAIEQTDETATVLTGSGPILQPFDPLAARPELWSRYHAFRRQRHAERDPDEPLDTDETVEGRMRIESKTWLARRVFVEEDGRMVGFTELESPKPGSPEYPTNRHLVYASLGVVGPYRRRGLGTALLRRALAELDERGARVLTCWTSEPDGHEFAARVGFQPKQVERISRLAFDAVDWAMIDRWIADLERRAPGTRLELYPVRVPDDFLATYCPARTKLMNLMPWDDADHGDIVVTPDDFRELAKRLDVSRTEHHTAITREPDDTISGITDVAWSPENPHEVEQWFTGVDPAYRGRGLGKALKAVMLRFCRERYADLRYIRTGNSVTNGSMLAINDRLGFQETRRFTTYQIERDALAAHLSGRR